MKMLVLQEFIADLHIHIGYVGGKAVKIPSSPDLTLENILERSLKEGINLIGIVDGGSLLVRQQLRQWQREERLLPQKGGGLNWADRVVIIPAAEIAAGKGEHYLAYFASLEHLECFIRCWEEEKSCDQVSAEQALQLVLKAEGWLVPAHIFTPHKSLLGNAASSLREVFSRESLPAVYSVELGLSADTFMADRISELASRSFFTNSDAHSLTRLGREFNVLLLAAASFSELQKAAKGEDGRQIKANFGLNPILGKYYRSFCRDCGTLASAPPPVRICPLCGSTRLDTGVRDRLELLADRDFPVHPANRPPYRYLVPLDFFPGLGKVTRQRLLAEFGSERRVLLEADLAEVQRVAGDRLAEMLAAYRQDKLLLAPGGGGRFGRVLGVEGDIVKVCYS